MNALDISVIGAGAAAIGWVCWYFFYSSGRSASASAADDGTQEVSITVKGGYDPALVRVRAGLPVRFIFDRQETTSCSEEIVFPDFGIRKFLPAFQKTVVDLRVPERGRYEFTCGMSMLRGTMVAE